MPARDSSSCSQESDWLLAQLWVRPFPLEDGDLLIESAWAYQYRPWLGGFLRKRQQGLDEDVKDIAWKAQWRLHTRYKKLAAAGKKELQIVTAVGRELLGFIWAIAVKTEAKFQSQRKAA